MSKFNDWKNQCEREVAGILFKGESNSCEEKGSKNCCSGDGWSNRGDNASYCSRGALKIQSTNGKNRNYLYKSKEDCASEIAGICLKYMTTRNYCVWDITIAKIINVAARDQLNGGATGFYKKYGCIGVSSAEINRLNFNTIDFSTVFGDAAAIKARVQAKMQEMTNKMKAKATTRKTGGSAQSQVDDYYKKRRGDK